MTQPTDQYTHLAATLWARTVCGSRYAKVARMNDAQCAAMVDLVRETVEAAACAAYENRHKKQDWCFIDDAVRARFITTACNQLRDGKIKVRIPSKFTEL